MPWLSDQARSGLARIRADQQIRQRRCIRQRDARMAMLDDGRSLRVFCSNDYLGLAADARLQQAATAAAQGLGQGSTASQHVCGFHYQQQALEAELADWLHVERVLVGGSGYALNTGAIPLLGQGAGLIASDALNHASLIDGCRLSKTPVQRYAHNDMAALAQLLDSPAGRDALIVSDAIFSMEGDSVALPSLQSLSAQYGAAVYLDDAHGFGWAGGGRGSVAGAGMDVPDDWVQMVTFGKSLGGYGAALAGHRDLLEWLLQRGRTTMFATALPPSVCAAARQALAILRAEPEHVAALHSNIAQWRALIEQRSWKALPSTSPIQALVLGTEARALAWQQALEARGFWVSAIRPPTVPANTARLRVTLSAAHTAEDIHELVAALDDIAAQETAAEQAVA
nr:8-amino-7-oxononanoate synthase [Oceanococcus sp. HetDA_MAG_MS8]